MEKYNSHGLRGMMTRASEPLGMRTWITLPGKPHSLAEVLNMGEGNLKWVVQEEKDEYQ